MSDVIPNLSNQLLDLILFFIDRLCQVWTQLDIIKYPNNIVIILFKIILSKILNFKCFIGE